MELIYTTAPISTVDLKRKFSEDVGFVIDCDQSKFKGKVLITYLSNLNIKCKLVIESDEHRLQLIESYLRSPIVVDIPDLNNLAMQVLVEYLGLGLPITFDAAPVIEQCGDILEIWVKRLSQLVLFGAYVVEENKELVKQYPEDTTTDLSGINYIHLIKHTYFPLLIENVPEKELTWNKVLFDDYVFAGNNLYHYFSHPLNPLLLAITSEVDPEFGVTLAKELNEFAQTAVEQLEGLSYVSPN